MARSRASPQWASVCLLLFIATRCFAQSNFDFYPEDSQQCLNSAAARTDCESNDVAEMNTCFCGNGDNFIINVAICVGEEAQNDIQAVYDTMQGACSDSDTPMSVSQSDFFAAANGEDVSTTTTTTTTTQEPTSTGADSTSTETSSEAPTATETEGSDDDGNSDESGGLSQGATIGIGVGAGVGGIALISAIAFFFIRRRKRQSEESKPMLPNHQYNSPTTFPPSEPSPGFGAFTDAKTSPSASPYSNATHSGVWQPPPMFQGQGSPQPYPSQPYQPFPSQSTGYAPQHTFSDGPVEIDGVQQNVAEMPGSSPQPAWKP